MVLVAPGEGEKEWVLDFLQDLLFILDMLYLLEFNDIVDGQGLQGKVGGGWLVETQRDNGESA